MNERGTIQSCSYWSPKPVQDAISCWFGLRIWKHMIPGMGICTVCMLVSGSFIWDIDPKNTGASGNDSLTGVQRPEFYCFTVLMQKSCIFKRWFGNGWNYFSEMARKERRSLQLAELKWVNLFPSECLFLMMLEILFCCKIEVLSTARTLARITS